MGLPDLQPNGNLPSGVHWASWEEIVARFGFNDARQELLAGLRGAVVALAAAGCRVLYLDGSFVTAKPEPRDYDGCWEPRGVDPTGLDPLFYEPRFLAWPRKEQKIKYKGELFPASFDAARGGPVFLQFFQLDRDTGDTKGIVAIDLGGLT